MGSKDIHLVAILDRSGSMSRLTEEMRNGFNTLRAQQLKEDGDTYLTLVTFDTEYDRLYTGVNARLVPDLTKEQYFARGGTALFDAIGRTLTEVATLKNLPKKTLVVIATDGQENSSKEWISKAKIKELITKYQDRAKNPWSFIFMGMGVDAFDERQYGFTSSTRTLNTTSDYTGTQVLYGAVGSSMGTLRDTDNFTLNQTDISTSSNVDYGNNPTPVVDSVTTPVESKSVQRRKKVQKEAVTTP